MSIAGDRNRLIERRGKITANATPCPVCGRPVVFRTPVQCAYKVRLLRPKACSTTCGVLLAQRKVVSHADTPLP